jgi:hypothetical protein
VFSVIAFGASEKSVSEQCSVHRYIGCKAPFKLTLVFAMLKNVDFNSILRQKRLEESICLRHAKEIELTLVLKVNVGKHRSKIVLLVASVHRVRKGILHVNKSGS